MKSSNDPAALGVVVGIAKYWVWVIEALQVGQTPVENAPAADEHPYFTHKPSPHYKSDNTVPSAKYLVLDSIQGELTQREVEGMKNYLLEFPTPSTNYHFRRRFMPYIYDMDLWENR